jgi:phosphatidylglycerol:prolipoprotein diacylglycerol transferase
MIRIGMDPEIFATGNFGLSWHGLLSLVAVALAVYLVARWAPRHGISSDDVYATAIWGIIGGIVGARLFHVVDEWRFYSQNPSQIIAIWTGGIAIWGAVLGGFTGGYIYAARRGLPTGVLADITAPAMALAMAVGRIGDIINGEHVSRTTSMPWGIIWSNPKSLTFQKYGLMPTHPAVAYEMLWDIVIFSVLWFVLRGRLRPNGMLFAAFLAMYAFGRFFISFFREDRTWALSLTQAQWISIIVLAITVPLLAYRAKMVPRQEAGGTGTPTRTAMQRRAQRPQ